MRPVVRGDVPTDQHGQAKQYGEYPQARRDLVGRLGDYCSYCERQLDADLAVEHVKPKRHNPAHQLDWNNFLLGCRNCNSIKGDTNVVLGEYYWPDQDNTAAMFEYSQGGVISISSLLMGDEVLRAQYTIGMTGLDRKPADDPEMKDRRWEKRREVWGVAEASLADLRACHCDQMRQQIVRTAIGRGYFSVWMTVFALDSDMCRRFIEAFVGTDAHCFDANGNPTQAIAR